MKAIYYQRGETLDYTPAENLEAGDVVSLGSRIGIAAETTLAGMLGHLHVVGVFQMPKAAGEAFHMGDAIGYNAEEDVMTAASDETIPAGYAIADAAAEDAMILVKLSG